MFATLGQDPSFGQPAPAPRGELRIVDKGPLNWALVTWQVFEHLIEHEDVLRQMERHTHEQAYFLFLYHPIRLYAVNRNVEFVSYAISWTSLADSSLTDQPWSLRKGNGKK